MGGWGVGLLSMKIRTGGHNCLDPPIFSTFSFFFSAFLPRIATI